MPYGVRKGGKSPADFGIGDVSGLALSGGAGILAALVTDYTQRGEASALFQINEWAVSAAAAFGLAEVPLWWVMLGLVAVGAGSVFFFQPVTRQAAFAQGFGLLAAAMTAIPANVAGGLPSTQPVPAPAVVAPDAPAEEATDAAYRIGEGRPVAVQGQREETYAVKLTVTFPNGAPRDLDAAMRKGTVRGRLHNEGSKETYDLFRTAGGKVDLKGKVLTIVAGVPARAKSTTLWVRIECEGYAIEEQSAKTSLDRPLDWAIAMRPSKTPLFVQRLGKSYWF